MAVATNTNVSALSVVAQKLDDLTECPVCAETLSSPRMLPCMHLFCLHCLLEYGKDKQPGDNISCPVCRRPTKIPAGGFKSIPVNFFVENIIEHQREVHKLSNMGAVSGNDGEGGGPPLCENCRGKASGSASAGRAGKDGVPAVARKASAYCLECKQKLCAKCTDAHKKMKLTAEHQIVVFDENSSPALVIADSLKRRAAMCELHPDKRVSQFCATCRRLVCSACLAAQLHRGNGHVVVDLALAAKNRAKQTRRDIKAVTEHAAEYQRKIRGLDKERAAFIAEVEKAKLDVCRRTDEMARLIDRNKKQLLMELETLQADKLRGIDAVKEGLEMITAMFGTVRRFGTELINKGGSTDIIRLSDDLHTQAMDLFGTPIKSVNWIGIRFRVSDRLQKLQLLTANNLIGEIVPVEKTIGVFDRCCEVDPLSTYLPNPVLLSSMPEPAGGQCIEGIAVLDNEVFTIRAKVPEIQVFDVENLQPRRRIPLPGPQPQDIAVCQLNRCLYVCDWGSTNSVHRVRVSDNHAISAWVKLRDRPGGLSVTRSGTVLVTSLSTSQLTEYTADGTLMRKIQLQQDFDKPWHSLMLPVQIGATADQFVVCRWHRLCIVGADGGVCYSYGGEMKGGSPGQLDCPSHLAADRNGNILIADCNNHRIKLLGPSLQELGEKGKDVVTRDHGVISPHRIHLDIRCGRLYIGLGDGQLVVYRVLI